MSNFGQMVLYYLAGIMARQSFANWRSKLPDVARRARGCAAALPLRGSGPDSVWHQYCKVSEHKILI